MSIKPCAFCGSTDNQMSREHVWPSWIRDLLPPEDLKVEHTYRFETSDEGVTNEFQAGVFTATVKDVCVVCNNGWMSEIEDRAQRLISGVFQGRGRELYPSGQTTLARWGLLKGLVAQRAFRGRESGIPGFESHYRELYELGPDELPADLSIYTAKTGYSKGKGVSGFFRMNAVNLPSAGEPDQVNGYVLAFSVMDLAIIAFRSMIGERVEFQTFNRGPDLDRSLTRIWPTTKTFIWPATPSITYRGLRAIAGGDELG